MPDFFPTSAELATFLLDLSPVVVSDAETELPQLWGEKTWLANSSSNDVAFTLPTALGCGQGATIVIVKAHASNALSVTGVINGVSQTVSTLGAFNGFRFIRAADGSGWICTALDALPGGVADPGSSLEQLATLQSSPQVAGSYFGQAIAISPTRAVVGAPWEDNGGTFRGAAYVFDYSGGSWSQTAKLTPSGSEDAAFFGHSVALDGDRCLVSAYAEDGAGTNRGAAYVFDLSGTWSETQRLVPSSPADSAQFGSSVALDGDRCLIGALGDDDGGTVAGAAYVFDLSGTWSQTIKLTSDNPKTNGQFGARVALDGDRCLIGAPGEDGAGTNYGGAYVFDLSGTWSLTTALTTATPENSSNFGAAVALDGDRCLIGAPGEDGAGTDRGAAYVFDLSGTWSETQRIIPSTPEDSAYFGLTLGLIGDRLIVGAPFQDNGGTNRGSVYQFDLDGTWSQTAELTPDTPTDNSQFGYEVALTTDLAAIWDKDADDTYKGTVYLFST